MSFLQELLSSLEAKARQNGVFVSRQSGREESGLARLESACDTLMHHGGEASRILIARQALSAYRTLDTEQQRAFFHLLADQYAADPAAIHAAYARYRETEDNTALQALGSACEPRRQSLFRRLNQCPGGTYELVQMRSDLLAMLKDHPELAPLDADFAHLFASWFNRGFLMLEAIDWNTSAAVLEKVIRYEAVHAIHDWNDLRQRLDPGDRRCYAFFHPATGDEPLIFVEVALCRGIPDNIQSILESDEHVAPEDADTAVFYSISNCQAGLKGISFGNFLIKQVVEELQRELPQLENFVTLSPVPGLRKWLDQTRSEGGLPGSSDVLERLEAEDWLDDKASRSKMASDVTALAGHYLLDARRRGAPADPVARFHLGNGARLHRINWPGDTSVKGRQQSHGVMVNYLYEPGRIEQNHEAFSREGTIACSSEVRRAAKQGQQRFTRSRDKA
ncbi:malonyl-CoA decarboxylase [Larsenimonas rhizosphaerae]|uniref:malonyl-CoA decarboxylase n=1 Tax=Larsenimonas rhizosphaerae TaxID=2944682 RepID=UPI00203380BF|nr:malonyl-CoA decarboxylase [Larsenimonas rhizosphaerae]MCM2129763.1 malonyl-CoA decarboxylase [Larsenimonas rhizosphaerae]